MVVSLGKAASIAARSLTPDKPYHVQWMITRRCNFRCKGCSVWQEQDDRELSTEKVKKGIDILRDLGVVEIVLSGGNPLLRKDIGEIVEYASRYLITTVYDNGSMALKSVDALRHADFVAVSIDSLDEKKNDYAKGVKGAWRNAMEAIERLHEKGIQVGAAPTISQFNLHEISSLTQRFLSKGIPVWFSLYSYDTLDDQNSLFKIGKKNDGYTITDKEAFVNLCDFLMVTKKKDSNLLMTTKLLKALKNLYLTGERSWKCRALQSFFMIDHLGRVAGCHLHNPVASIFDLPRAWHSPKLDVLRETYSKCTQCTYLCYVFYSLHGGVLGNFQIAQDRWKNAKFLLRKKNFMPLDLAEQR